MTQSRPQLLRTYFFVGGIALVAVLLFFTDQLVRRMERESLAVSFLFAQFAANTASTSTDQDPEVLSVYRDVLARINFPIILTDRSGRPRVWRHVGVDLDEVTEDEISTLDFENPPVTGGVARLLAEMEKLDAQNQPIDIRRPNESQIFGRVHYGISPLVTQLKLFPLLELALVATFGFLALLAYRSIKDSEQRSVWVGMARETAHQLGTPISSLMGWLELLKERGGEGKESVTLEAAFFEDVVTEMDNDIARLEKIAARFSNVGSAPKLQQQDIVPVVGEAIQYLTRRLPHLHAKIRVEEHLDEVPPVNINRELMEWVVENVLKNAMDAVDKETGVIKVEVRREPNTETVDIRVTDNGRGMLVSEQRRVFEPGYSTKRRGWGLGLSLSRRIVEEYHGGRIFVERSAPGEGSTFVIQFPV